MNQHEEWFLEASGFNASWEKYVDGIRQENIRSNNRLIKVLAAIKGKEFCKDLKKMMKTLGEHKFMELSRTASGTPLSDNRWKTIPRFNVDIKSDGTGAMTGFIYIPIKENRFLKISVSF